MYPKLRAPIFFRPGAENLPQATGSAPGREAPERVGVSRTAPFSAPHPSSHAPFPQIVSFLDGFLASGGFPALKRSFMQRTWSSKNRPKPIQLRFFSACFLASFDSSVFPDFLRFLLHFGIHFLCFFLFFSTFSKIAKALKLVTPMVL